MRSHYCGELDASHVDREVELCGWVHRRRDHGGVAFIDLRDASGVAARQVTLGPADEVDVVCQEQRSDLGLPVVDVDGIDLREAVQVEGVWMAQAPWEEHVLAA